MGEIESTFPNWELCDGDSTAYTYDAENRLTSVAAPDDRRRGKLNPNGLQTNGDALPES